MRYVYTGATPDTLESGRPVAHGETLDLSRAQERANARLIDAGVLRPLPAKPKTKEGDK